MKSKDEIRKQIKLWEDMLKLNEELSLSSDGEMLKEHIVEGLIESLKWVLEIEDES